MSPVKRCGFAWIDADWRVKGWAVSRELKEEADNVNYATQCTHLGFPALREAMPAPPSTFRIIMARPRLRPQSFENSTLALPIFTKLHKCP